MDCCLSVVTNVKVNDIQIICTLSMQYCHGVWLLDTNFKYGLIFHVCFAFYAWWCFARHLSCREIHFLNK